MVLYASQWYEISLRPVAHHRLLSSKYLNIVWFYNGYSSTLLHRMPCSEAAMVLVVSMDGGVSL
jgi:hypothetical protein